jgi:hypothetical protein
MPSYACCNGSLVSFSIVSLASRGYWRATDSKLSVEEAKPTASIYFILAPRITTAIAWLSFLCSKTTSSRSERLCFIYKTVAIVWLVRLYPLC